MSEPERRRSICPTLAEIDVELAYLKAETRRLTALRRVIAKHDTDGTQPLTTKAEDQS